MKVTKIGGTEFIIQTFYTDNEGHLNCSMESWHIKKNAKDVYERRKRFIGKPYFFDNGMSGIIKSVYILKAHLCEID
jgi:hypothetical protein